MIANLELVGSKSVSPVYQLKIELVGTDPSVWRTLQVTGQANLGWLHAVLQTAMGWTNSHLHHFLTSDARYSDPRGNQDSGFGDEPDRDETKVTLMQIAPQAGAQFGYEYDFGDSWEHAITVQQILPAAGGPGRSLFERRGSVSAGGLRGHLGLRRPAGSPERSPAPGAQEHPGMAGPCL